ncbi:MAG: arginine--tRNA ligase [Gammaproteobacteria bacterium]|nr:arginine--tRNA ligase [Gammaproteobacteria bacterium]
MNIQIHLKQLTHEAFRLVFPAETISPEEIEIAQTKDSKLGHYQCNSAMRLGKRLTLNPRDIAEKIKTHLAQNAIFEYLEIAGPGFINYQLAAPFIEAQVKSMLSAPALGLLLEKPERIIVDFSSPNVAKEMHVGHLRSTIIGDCLARIFEFLGNDVLRLNHIGDWGTAFGMLICHMEAQAPQVLNGGEGATLQDLMHWYRESKKRFDEEEPFKKAAQLKVVSLQRGEPSALKAWSVICAISEAAYREIYDLLDIKITSRGESFYNPYLDQTLNDLNKKGLITESEGAKCIFIEGFKGKEGEPLPLMVQKSDGGYGYASTDMAAIWHRSRIEKADRIIYVTDGGQGTHFAMVFAAALKAGYIDRLTQVAHVPFGLVLGPDGKKFKTRSGETEKLIDLLKTAVSEAKTILIDRGTPTEGVDKMARALGINAVKYADLSCNRVQDYQFSYERMLKFEGNTAAFIMYSLVRVLSIQRKIGVTAIDPAQLNLTHPSEIELALHLARFSETIAYVTKELYPHRLTDYLYQLAQHFNAFFRDCRVEADPKQASRLVLCELSVQVFKTGMHLLGLHVLQRM